MLITILTLAMVVLTVLCLLLMGDVRKLTEWKRQIEGKTDFGDWLLVSKQEWDDFRKYFYVSEWDTKERLEKLERRLPVDVKGIVPNKWKPWAR